MSCSILFYANSAFVQKQSNKEEQQEMSNLNGAGTLVNKHWPQACAVGLQTLNMASSSRS